MNTMFISPTDLLVILENYKYWIIFPIAIFEGPIIIIITGFLIQLGVLNSLVAYAVVVTADIIGDSLYYSIGRLWRKAEWIKRYGRFLGYDEKSEEFLEEHFKKHKIKTFMIGKVSHGVGGSVQIASGIAKVSYIEFLLISLMGTMPKTLILILIGFFAGSYYERINGYLHYIGLVTFGIVLVVLFLVISKKVKKNFFKGIDGAE